VTEDGRLRLFIALELPESVRDALAEWRSEVIGAVPALRPVPAESLHVTLCFLGWRFASEVSAIGAACTAAGSVGRAALTVADALWLPPRRPRVLSVALSDDSGRLSAVQALLSHELEAGGWYVPEKRPFLAHVTVARMGKEGRREAGGRVGEKGRRGVGKGGRVGRDVALADPPPLSFEGSTVTLFQSRLSPKGAQYVALATVALAG
jgi:RNA 2',3'-cyclic 3'-phosphodiesterase